MYIQSNLALAIQWRGGGTNVDAWFWMDHVSQ